MSEIPGANPAPPEQPAPTVETVQRTKTDLTNLRARLAPRPTTPRTPEQQREIDALIADAATLIADLGRIETPETFNETQARALMQRSTLLLQQMTSRLPPAEASAFVSGINRAMESLRGVTDQLGELGSEQLEGFADFLKMLGMNGLSEFVKRLSSAPKARLKTIKDKLTSMNLTYQAEANEAAEAAALGRVNTQFNAIRTQMNRKATALAGTRDKQAEAETARAEATGYRLGAYLDAALANRGAETAISLTEIETFGRGVLTQVTNDATAAEAARAAAPIPAPQPTTQPGTQPAGPAPTNGNPPAAR